MTSVVKCSVYCPNDCEDFVALHPGLYHADAPPVPSKVAPRLIHDIADMFGARKTHASVAKVETSTSVVPFGGGGNGSGDGNAGNTMNGAMEMMSMMFRGFMQMQQGSAPCELQIGGRSGGRSSKNLLALPDIDRAAGAAGGAAGGGAPAGQADGADAAGGHGGDDGAAGAGGGGAAGDTVDQMLDQLGGKPKATKGKTAISAKAAAKGAAKAAAKGAAKAAAKAKPVKRKTKATPARVEPVVHDKRPPMSAACPLMYKGCKVHVSEPKKGFRVFPKPDASVYDKPFAWGDNKKAAWKACLDFCEKPSIPKDSKHYVK